MKRFTHSNKKYFLTRQLMGGFLVLASLFFMGLDPAEARRGRPTRKATQYDVEFRANDPKDFYKTLSYHLENQPPDNILTIGARSTVAELLFETENYREAAQIYLLLTEA